MFAGQMGCEALNFLLKRLIKEERPKRTSNGCAFNGLRIATAPSIKRFSKIHQLSGRSDADIMVD